jgi:hypothetical protein
MTTGRAHCWASERNDIATRRAVGHDGSVVIICYGNANGWGMAQRFKLTREAAESVAVQALSFIAEEPEQLGRFLAMSGIGPESLRAAAAEPGFLAGVLDHLLADEQLLIAFAERAGLGPAEIGRARGMLGGAAWERDIP